MTTGTPFQHQQPKMMQKQREPRGQRSGHPLEHFDNLAHLLSQLGLQATFLPSFSFCLTDDCRRGLEYQSCTRGKSTRPGCVRGSPTLWEVTFDWPVSTYSIQYSQAKKRPRTPPPLPRQLGSMGSMADGCSMCDAVSHGTTLR